MGRNQRDEPVVTFAFTNWNSDVAITCDGAADNEIADALGTLVKALAEGGDIAGTATA